MATYRYEKKIVIQAINYSEAKRQIEARIRCQINPFRLEIQMPNGEFPRQHIDQPKPLPVGGFSGSNNDSHMRKERA